MKLQERLREGVSYENAETYDVEDPAPLIDDAEQTMRKAADELDRLEAENVKLRECLRGMHDDNMDYLTRNKLGGENNHWMRQARALLEGK